MNSYPSISVGNEYTSLRKLPMEPNGANEANGEPNGVNGELNGANGEPN